MVLRLNAIYLLEIKKKLSVITDFRRTPESADLAARGECFAPFFPGRGSPGLGFGFQANS